MLLKIISITSSL